MQQKKEAIKKTKTPHLVSLVTKNNSKLINLRNWKQQMFDILKNYI